MHRFLPKTLAMIVLLSGVGVALSACQTPEGVPEQASVVCPIVSGPNESPYGSRALSYRMCQRERAIAAAKANHPVAADAQ